MSKQCTSKKTCLKCYQKGTIVPISVIVLSQSDWVTRFCIPFVNWVHMSACATFLQSNCPVIFIDSISCQHLTRYRSGWLSEVGRWSWMWKGCTVECTQ